MRQKKTEGIYKINLFAEDIRKIRRNGITKLIYTQKSVGEMMRDH